MKPERKLAETIIRPGLHLTLHEHDGSYAIRVNGKPLMHSRLTASELLLGELAVDRQTERPGLRVLIGGLGLGYSLRGVLDVTNATAAIHVAELLPAVVAWNREFLAALNGALLDDPRVTIFSGDVRSLLARAALTPYDAILLDIDNGPMALVQRSNARIYSPKGIRRLLAALKPGGRAAIWSASPDQAFADRLTEAGCHVETVPAKLYPAAKRHGCLLYLADKPPA